MSAMRIFRQPVQFNFRGLDNMQHEKEKWIQEAFQYIKDIYSLLYTSYTNFGCLFLHTLYFIDGYVIQGGRKLSMNFFLMWIDSMLERTRHLIQHSITGSIFLKKRLSPFIRTLQHIGNFLEAKSSASCPIFYTFNGCVEYTKQSFARKVIYYTHAINSFCTVLQKYKKKSLLITNMNKCF